MRQVSDRILITSAREKTVARFRRWGLIAIPLAAILFQVYTPLFFDFLANLELPLLVTVYFALLQRSAIAGTFIGATIGLAQDSLSHQPLGMFGIVKTLVGYFAASIGVSFDVEHPVVRFLLSYFFFCFHQLFYWVLARALLGQKQMLLNPKQIAILALVNAVVGVFLFHFLDKLKERN